MMLDARFWINLSPILPLSLSPSHYLPVLQDIYMGADVVSVEGIVGDVSAVEEDFGFEPQSA